MSNTPTDAILLGFTEVESPTVPTDSGCSVLPTASEHPQTISMTVMIKNILFILFLFPFSLPPSELAAPCVERLDGLHFIVAQFKVKDIEVLAHPLLVRRLGDDVNILLQEKA